MSSSREPTWNNPDIGIHDDSGALAAEPSITVHNRSATTPAVGVQAELFVGRFGIGMELESVGIRAFDLNAGGLSTIPFLLPSRFRSVANLNAKVVVRSSVDADASNNEGEYSVVFAAEPGLDGLPANVRIPLRNASPTPQEFHISVGSHQDLIVALPSPVIELAPFEQQTLVIQLVWVLPPTEDGEVTLFVRTSDGDLVGGATCRYEAEAP